MTGYPRDMTSIIPEPEADLAASPAHQAEMELAAKYACEGPRYTSYPTAPQFRQDFPLDQYLAWQQRDGDHKRAPLSLYLHLPFCRDICYYCACNKIVTRQKGVARQYLDRLQREIERQSALVGSNRPITQMHWGGGTPTYLDNAEITELMHTLASNFRLLDKEYREYSIEIDPRTVDHSTIALLKGVGFNRISLGIQDFDPVVQQSVNRVQPYEMVAPLVDNIRSHHFRSLSFDLIYGLPHQDRHTMQETLRKVVTLRPDRIACYNYAHLPERFSSQRAIDRLTLPSARGETAAAADDQPHPAGCGLPAYRHGPLRAARRRAGTGPAGGPAAAQLPGLFTAHGRRPAGAGGIGNQPDRRLLPAKRAGTATDYYRLVDAGGLPFTRGCKVTTEDKLRRHIIMSLICDLRLDIGDCNRQFGIDFKCKVSRGTRLAGSPWQRTACWTSGTGRSPSATVGRPFLRNICMPFDAYLSAHRGDQPPPRFSATI